MGTQLTMLYASTKQSLNQVTDILLTIRSLNTDKQQLLYCDLNIGKHVRHVNDHFLALKKGLETGTIDYNCRNRGTAIETDSLVALNELYQLIDWLDDCKEKNIPSNMDQKISVVSEIDCLQTEIQAFESSIAREFLYLINHTIHHAAHMSLIMKNQNIAMDQNIGLAPGTRTFLRTSKAS